MAWALLYGFPMATVAKYARFPSAPKSKAVPEFVRHYHDTLETAWKNHDWSDVAELVDALRRCWQDRRQVFFCGNGGSAANALHLANDFLYGIAKADGRGLRVTALTSNSAVMTCLGNDIGYADIFSQQLSVLGEPGDLLLALSGSGNSPNIVKALERARELNMTSYAILGYSGGKCLTLADHPIHFPVNDMQVAEDLQVMIGHMLMQELSKHRANQASSSSGASRASVRIRASTSRRSR